MNAAASQPATGARIAANAPVRTLAVLAAESNSFAQSLLDELNQLQPQWHCLLDDTGAGVPKIALASSIYVPSLASGDGMTPDLIEAKRFLESAAIQQSSQLVLLSSALIYGTGPGRNGLVSEDYSFPGNGDSRISGAWRSLEALAHECMSPAGTLTILRPAIVLGWTGSFSRLLSKRLAHSLPGHDPVLQILSPSDLAAAVSRAVTARKAGVFNVAPDGVIPLHQAIRLGGGRRIPVPRTLRRIVQTSDALDLFRYSWTISDARIRIELGFAPRKSSLAALREYRQRDRSCAKPEPRFDEFGMDESYIRFYGKSLFKFLSEYYWRIEDKGTEHIPRQGPGVLVGMHRGFMPWDGVMALHMIGKKTGRYPRFLTHPALLKFPFLANFMTKLGGVPACQESAEFVLRRKELLGIFPEGIHGAFTPYRQAYKLKAFGRDAFVKLALRHGAPIIPFVTVGSVEIFPIFGKIKSRLWTGYSGWPFIPITPTFPIFPVPLPSKWHTQFLPPISLNQYPPEAADDAAVVKAISLQVRTRMQQAVDDMLGRRRSIFFGSIFRPEAG